MSQQIEKLYAKRKARLEKKFENDSTKLSDRISRLDKWKQSNLD